MTMIDDSYFSKEDIDSMIAELKENPQSPEWLSSALELFPELQELIQPEEDENRFVVEYIYPH